MARKGIELSVSTYEEPKLDVPTFYIDTTGEYSPPTTAGIFFVHQKQEQ